MIVFSNPGSIDMRGVTTFGVNAKAPGSNPIGFFGTGIKFAIAVLLRNGCTIEIHTAGKVHHFYSRTDTVRGKEFDFVHMGTAGAIMEEDTPLAFTTALGPTWKLWQAYRELYCNCVTDEGGTVEKLSDETPLGVAPDHTVVLVRGEAFEAEHDNRENYILDPERKPRLVVPGVIEVYDGSSVAWFYRGINVGEVPTGAGRYTYNVLATTYLSEDRRAWYEGNLTERIAEAVLSGLDDAYTKDVLNTVDTDGEVRKGVEAQINYEGRTLTEKLFSMGRSLIETTAENISKSFRHLHRDYEREHLLLRPVDLAPAELEHLNTALTDCRRIGLAFDGVVRVVADLGSGMDAQLQDSTLMLDAELFSTRKDERDLRFVIAKEVAQQRFGSNFGDHLLAHVFKLALPALRADPPGFKWDEENECWRHEREPADTKRLVLFAEWSGYRSDQRKVAHREFVTPERAERLKCLHTIQFADNTTLDISVQEMTLLDIPNFKPLLQYDSLIKEAEWSGKSYYRVGIDDKLAETPPVPSTAPATPNDDIQF